MASSPAQLIRHVFFDLDDTLVPGAAIYERAMKDIGLDQAAPSFKAARTAVKEVLHPGNPASHSRALYFKRMLETEGKYSHKRWLELTDAYENRVAELMKKKWDELHRDALMETLLTMDITISIITNETSRMQLKKLSLLDPDTKYFSHVTISEELGLGKPNLKMFQTALSRAGARISESLMVGDSVEKDFMPAQALGMAVRLTSEFLPPPADFAHADLVLEYLDDLPRALIPMSDAS